ncbi:hypothetical protein [Clostridium sp. CF012]|uniref:hypothetical protein n=1 Tax=Clostridium sp. CF012 TaxID=2843319 RepID=UPI00209B4ABE|nr:hypothetical protein [Clostridium sp. CF012]
MIDDLANVWVDRSGSGEVDLEEDWGYARNSENSSFRFLNEVILKHYPDVKVTFFTPVGIRVGMIENAAIKSISKMINCDEETKEFFRSIHRNDRFEIAYHGTTHGKVGKNIQGFAQEWELFSNLEQAISTVNYGKEVYKEVFGEYPKGGKYCGYSSNSFSDNSIDKTGFSWWCRFCNLDTKDVAKKGYFNKFIYGEDSSNITNFDVKKFGDNDVIDIPTTINGEMFNSVIYSDTKTIKGMLKRILRKYLIKKRTKEIGYLLENNLVVSIQEHISPMRDDGKRQKPNIFDDQLSLKRIFDYLKGKNVWYCTGSELTEYVYLKDAIKLIPGYESRFSFQFNIEKQVKRNEITLKIVDNNKSILKTPDGNYLKINAGIVNVPLLQGEYELS